MSRWAATRCRLLAAAALFLLVAGPVPAGAEAWSLNGLHGESLAEADLAQGTTIVVVWATWSPKSRDIVQRTSGLVSRWGAGARILTVDFQEDRAEVDAFLAGKNLPAPVFLDTDGAFSKQYQVATLPGLLVFRDGKVAYHGKLPDDADKVLADLLE
jgi:thiol-disulfide isomerase/thioredoxin